MATVAMILNGLGFSNRRLYLVSQFFATKPVEHLLGAGITAELLHDDCLDGRSIGSMRMNRPRSSSGSRGKPGSALGWRASGTCRHDLLLGVGKYAAEEEERTKMPRWWR